MLIFKAIGVSTNSKSVEFNNRRLFHTQINGEQQLNLDVQSMLIFSLLVSWVFRKNFTIKNIFFMTIDEGPAIEYTDPNYMTEPEPEPEPEPELETEPVDGSVPNSEPKLEFGAYLVVTECVTKPRKPKPIISSTEVQSSAISS